MFLRNNITKGPSLSANIYIYNDELSDGGPATGNGHLLKKKWRQHTLMPI